MKLVFMFAACNLCHKVTVTSSADVWALGCTLYDIFARNGSHTYVQFFFFSDGVGAEEALQTLREASRPRCQRSMGHDPLGYALIHCCLKLASERPPAEELCRTLMTKGCLNV